MATMRKWRDIIEKMDGGFLVDCEGDRRIENAQGVARLIIRIWPEVVNHIAVELEETHGTLSQAES